MTWPLAEPSGWAEERGLSVEATRKAQCAVAPRNEARPGATDIVEERGDEGIARIKDLTGGLQRRRPRSLTWAFMLQMVAGVGFEPTTFGL